MADRRTSRGARPGSRRPVGPRGTRPRQAVASPGGPVPRRTTPRPRLTGRAAILVLVLAVLTVSYASSMRAYLQQRDHIASLRAQIADSESDIADLEREKRRWDDPAYVRTQARQRFGYQLPGETSYQVLDENGEPLDSPDELTDPASMPRPEPRAWWETAWASVEAAGNPPAAKEQPATRIGAPAE